MTVSSLRPQAGRLILLVGVFFLSALVIPSVRAQRMPPIELEHFKRIGSVRFEKPDTLMIARIDQVDVDAAGRFLVTDDKGEQILLFDSTGTLQASLDSSICEPGYVFAPDGARFTGVGSIFILTYANHWGYRFNEDGTCLGKVDRDFIKPKFFSIDSAGALYGAYDGPEREIRRMSATGRVLDRFPIPPGKFPNADDRFHQGGLVADGAHVFYASATGQAILKFALDGTLVGRISQRSSWFRSPRRDLPPDVSSQLFDALREWSATSTWSMFELTDQTLMVQYVSRERGTGYQVFTKGGELLAEEFGLKTLFLHGENGLVYLPRQAGFDSHGELPNPYLDIYRFIVP